MLRALRVEGLMVAEYTEPLSNIKNLASQASESPGPFSRDLQKDRKRYAEECTPTLIRRSRET
jgi:hypothetical protein